MDKLNNHFFRCFSLFLLIRLTHSVDPLADDRTVWSHTVWRCSIERERLQFESLRSSAGLLSDKFAPIKLMKSPRFRKHPLNFDLNKLWFEQKEVFRGQRTIESIESRQFPFHNTDAVKLLGVDCVSCRQLCASEAVQAAAQEAHTSLTGQKLHLSN